MTEQTQQPPSAPLLTYQQVRQTRQLLIQLLNRNFTQFLQSINWISGDEASIHEGMALIDAGILSLQKGILLSPVAHLPKLSIVPTPEIPLPNDGAVSQPSEPVDPAPVDPVPTDSQPDLPPAA